LKHGIDLALHHAQGRACHILARPSWHLASLAPMIAHIDRWLRLAHPTAKLVSMVTTEADERHIASLGVNAIRAHNLAFVDEHVFYPESGVAKLYDAVHSGQTKRFKRHELAYGVPNLALITYAEGGNTERVRDLARHYRHLGYVNYSEADGCKSLDGDGIRYILNRARCGLALSELEGPHNASMEYFLCGLPLVTTPAVGGREAMYDPRHVTIVEPQPEAVEAAVAAYRLRAPDPTEIRASALAKAREHRARLISWLSNVAGEDLFRLADENLWLPQFRDKLRQTWRIEDRPDGTFAARPIPGWARPHP
ncbi:MAG: hypothetical protein ACREFI_00565, partial [Stellaceae bacterium]